MNSATQAVIERQPVGGAAAVDELGIVAAFVREAMHPSGTWGTVGAAAARLMGFDAARIRETMTVAAPRWVGAGFPGAPDDVAQVFGQVSAERFDRGALVAGLGERYELLPNRACPDSTCPRGGA